MATKKGKGKRNMDRKLVSDQPHEKRYEADKLNVSQDEISKAKQTAGRSRKAIEDKLGKWRSEKWYLSDFKKLRNQSART